MEEKRNQEKKGGASVPEACQEKLRIVQDTLGEVVGSSPTHPAAPFPSNAEVITGFPLVVATLKHSHRTKSQPTGRSLYER